MNVHVRPQLVFVDKAFLADVADKGFLRVRSVMLELVVFHLGAAHDELAAVGRHDPCARNSLQRVPLGHAGVTAARGGRGETQRDAGWDREAQ